MAKIRKPYTGNRRTLVLACDVGTTFSGVSYAFLVPGEVPKIHGVTRFPGQEHVAGNSKIPTIIYYDKDGTVKAAGAEADTAQMASKAEDEGWQKVELFKLRLRPKAMKLDMNGMKLSHLPHGKRSTDVLGDFLRYLFYCTRKFIEDTHGNGDALWESVKDHIEFVLSHPNGWEGIQQTKMRRSAIYAGLIPDTDEGKSRIRFVTEGEASLHACVLSGLANDMLNTGTGFVVADAGGGTLDVSSYAVKGVSPLTIEEIAAADCVFAGSVFVSRRARVFLEEKLKNSRYGTPDALDHITKRFDETTKRLFRDRNEAQFIPFGSPLDKDLSVGIRGGQLKLSGDEVAELFEPSIQAAVSSIESQIKAASGKIKAVWLVGGFAANHWLFKQLRQRLAPLQVTVNRPDTQTSKAVADGAIGFFCDHHVSARMSKYMYGVEYLREVDPNDEDHMRRRHRIIQMPSGPKLLPDAFDCILAKNVRVKESSVFSRKYYTEVTKLSTLSVFEIEIWCYRGGDEIPKWILRDSNDFGSLCHVQADLSKLSDSAQPKQGPNGQTYWTVVFSIEIHFGLTEFKARIKWTENGETKYGPAVIVYNERGSRIEDEDLATLPDEDLYGRPPLSRQTTLSSRAASRPASSREGSSSRSKPRSVISGDSPSTPSSASRASSVRSRTGSNASHATVRSQPRSPIVDVVTPETLLDASASSVQRALSSTSTIRSPKLPRSPISETTREIQAEPPAPPPPVETPPASEPSIEAPALAELPTSPLEAAATDDPKLEEPKPEEPKPDEAPAAPTDDVPNITVEEPTDAASETATSEATAVEEAAPEASPAEAPSAETPGAETPAAETPTLGVTIPATESPTPSTEEAVEKSASEIRSAAGTPKTPSISLPDGVTKSQSATPKVEFIPLPGTPKAGTPRSIVMEFAEVTKASTPKTPILELPNVAKSGSMSGTPKIAETELPSAPKSAKGTPSFSSLALPGNTPKTGSVGLPEASRSVTGTPKAPSAGLPSLAGSPKASSVALEATNSTTGTPKSPSIPLLEVSRSVVGSPKLPMGSLAGSPKSASKSIAGSPRSAPKSVSGSPKPSLSPLPETATPEAIAVSESPAEASTTEQLASSEESSAAAPAEANTDAPTEPPTTTEANTTDLGPANVEEQSPAAEPTPVTATDAADALPVGSTAEGPTAETPETAPALAGEIIAETAELNGSAEGTKSPNRDKAKRNSRRKSKGKSLLSDSGLPPASENGTTNGE